MLKVNIGRKSVHNGQHLSWNEAQGDLTVTWNPSAPYYSLLIYDPEALKGTFTHSLIVNIPGNHIEEGEVLISYIPPSPPDQDHHYFIELYGQDVLYDFPQLNRMNATYEFQKVGFPLIDEIMFVVSPKLNNISPKLNNISPKLNNISPKINNRSPRINQQIDPPKSLSEPTEQQRKFCDCINKVEAKGGAYNPYAVCAHSVGTTFRHCSEIYNFDNKSDEELIGYLEREGLSLIGTRAQQTQRAKAFVAMKKH